MAERSRFTILINGPEVVWCESWRVPTMPTRYKAARRPTQREVDMMDRILSGMAYETDRAELKTSLAGILLEQERNVVRVPSFLTENGGRI